MSKKEDLKILFKLFAVFFKAGTFTFAGGLAMLPVIQRDLVEKYQLMSAEEFLEYATLSQTLPGIISLNCAVFVGRRAAGTAGMLVAGLGAVFSAFLLMIAATVLMQFIPQEGAFVGALQGIRAAAAALVLAAAFSIGRHNLKSAFAVIVMIIAFMLVLFAKVSAVTVVIAAGVTGYLYQKLTERRKSKGETQE